MVATQPAANARVENLGPAEHIISTLISYADHMVHNRPGIVVPSPGAVIQIAWSPATYKEQEGVKVVYQISKHGRRSIRTPIGRLGQDNKTVLAPEGERVVAEYRPAGLFPEVAEWMYKRVSEVWQLDNEFCARWASYAYQQDHRDMKVVLAAFMLCQSRKGDPVMENGKLAFHDEDFREVGEAMTLLSGDKDLNARMLLRIRDVLILPGVAEINRQLGFGKSARNPFLGRWSLAVQKWLRYREENPKMLQGLVKTGFRKTVMQLAEHIGYKPRTEKFFETLRWKQSQTSDGRRKIAIGKAVKAAESWDNLTEQQICELITKGRLSMNSIVGHLPQTIGLTRAIMAAAIEAGSLSKKELIIYSPTIEDLGLMDVQEIREKWASAVKEADDQRAANIATRMRSTAAKETLQEGSDNAIKKAVEEVTRGMRVYFMVDISGSMEVAMEEAKGYLAKFLQAFPPDRIHVSVFNTTGRELPIRTPTAAGVANAFRGLMASGGTDYGAGIYALVNHRPDPNEDVLFFFVGDEEAYPFSDAVRASALNPLAFGFVKVGRANAYNGVRTTATELGIPCFLVNPQTFDDPYAVPRTIRNLIASTPVSKVERPKSDWQYTRVTLVDQILKTPLLAKPGWV